MHDEHLNCFTRPSHHPRPCSRPCPSHHFCECCDTRPCSCQCCDDETLNLYTPSSHSQPCCCNHVCACCNDEPLNLYTPQLSSQHSTCCCCSSLIALLKSYVNCKVIISICNCRCKVIICQVSPCFVKIIVCKSGSIVHLNINKIEHIQPITSC